MTQLQIIKQYDDSIIQIYHQHSLKCLRGLAGEPLYELDSKNIYTWHGEAIKHVQNENNILDFMKNLDDLFLISDEIIYFLANAILYEPLINDPIRDKINVGNGNYIYPNYQNLYAKRYDMYIDICYEKIYNYWGRIGNLLAMCIDTGLQENSIYFSNAVDRISNSYLGNQNFDWLYNYKADEYTYLNSIRKNIVHRFGSGNEFSHNHTFASSNKDEIINLMRKRRQIPNNLKSAMQNTIEGFKHTLDFLIFVGQDSSN